MSAFQFDTSGTVRVFLGSSGGETETALYRWHNLTPCADSACVEEWP